MIIIKNANEKCRFRSLKPGDTFTFLGRICVVIPYIDTNQHSYNTYALNTTSFEWIDSECMVEKVDIELEVKRHDS